jgi:hypothetical protein
MRILRQPPEILTSALAAGIEHANLVTRFARQVRQ